MKRCSHCGESIQPPDPNEKFTTVRISEINAENLRKMMRYPETSINDTLTKLLNGDTEVFLDILAVNGEGKMTTESTVIFQLGDLHPRYFQFQKGVITPIPPPVMKVQERTPFI